MSRNTLLKNLNTINSIGLESEDDTVTDIVIAEPNQEIDGQTEQPPVIENNEDLIDHEVQEQVIDDVEQAEDAVALEAMFGQIDYLNRRAVALENLAEQISDTIEGEGVGLTPLQAEVITASADVLPEDVAQIATESFNFDQRIATEGLVDAIKEKAGSIRDSVANTIGNIVRSVGNKISEFLDFITVSHGRLVAYSKRASELDAARNTPISDEKVIKRLQKQLPMSGDGGRNLSTIIKQSLPNVVAQLSALAAQARSAASNTDATRPEKMTEGYVKFFKMLESFGRSSQNGLNITVETPSSFDVSSLMKISLNKNATSISLVEGEGNQSYTAISKRDLHDFIDSMSHVRAESEHLQQATAPDRVRNPRANRVSPVVNAAASGIRNVGEAMYAGKIEGQNAVFVAGRLGQLMYAIIARLTADLMLIATKICRHALILTAASFAAIGVSIADSASDMAA